MKLQVRLDDGLDNQDCQAPALPQVPAVPYTVAQIIFLALEWIAPDLTQKVLQFTRLSPRAAVNSIHAGTKISVKQGTTGKSKQLGDAGGYPLVGTEPKSVTQISKHLKRRKLQLWTETIRPHRDETVPHRRYRAQGLVRDVLDNLGYHWRPLLATAAKGNAVPVDEPLQYWHRRRETLEHQFEALEMPVHLPFHLLLLFISQGLGRDDFLNQKGPNAAQQATGVATRRTSTAARRDSPNSGRVSLQIRYFRGVRSAFLTHHNRAGTEEPEKAEKGCKSKEQESKDDSVHHGDKSSLSRELCGVMLALRR